VRAVSAPAVRHASATPAPKPPQTSHRAHGQPDPEPVQRDDSSDKTATRRHDAVRQDDGGGDDSSPVATPVATAAPAPTADDSVDPERRRGSDHPEVVAPDDSRDHGSDSPPSP
jgi:hypothetical protein